MEKLSSGKVTSLPSTEPWPMERNTGGVPREVAQLGSHQKVMKLHSRPMATIMQLMVLKLKWRESEAQPKKAGSRGGHTHSEYLQ